MSTNLNIFWVRSLRLDFGEGGSTKWLTLRVKTEDPTGRKGEMEIQLFPEGQEAEDFFRDLDRLTKGPMRPEPEEVLDPKDLRWVPEKTEDAPRSGKEEEDDAG